MPPSGGPSTRLLSSLAPPRPGLLSISPTASMAKSSALTPSRRVSVSYLPLNGAPNTVPFPLIDYVVEHTCFQSNTTLSTCHLSFVKNASTPFPSCRSFQKLHCVEALQTNVNVGEIPTFGEVGRSKASVDSPKEAHGDGCIDFREDLGNKDSTKMQRRKHVGQWSIGNLSWNKGVAHNAETRKMISERTREALKNPKVKRKMRKHARPHSDEIKAKIGASQRKLWAKRLNVRYQKQKFFHSWEESIAETAKKGGNGEEELEWDSYNQLVEELALLEINQAEEKRNAKEKAKETWRMRTEAARAKAEEMAQKMKERMKILAQKRIEREEKAKTRVKKPKRSKEKKKELAVAQEKKLKQNLRKIRERKSVKGQLIAVVPHIPALEKLDLEVIKKEKMRNEVSLADQLREAKLKRAQHAAAIDSSGPIQRSTNLR